MDMLRFEIAFDDKKVIREDKYDLDKMYGFLDEFFARYNLRKIGKGTYCDNGNENDFAHMWSIFWAFTKVPWFMRNVAKVHWYNNGVFEDVLQIIKEKNLEVAI